MANPFDEDSIRDSMLEHRLDDRRASHALTSEVLPENISYSTIASKLIADNYLLTALELHTELIEAGREVIQLREFFSNPGNFEQQAATSKLDVSSSIRRSSSQATLDSLDFARYSEDGERGTDERVAVLEFELRKAKETISALRTNLTVAAESESTTPEQGSTKSMKNDTIKPHEQRALNFLLNEYLLLHNYKLTSITFADENEDQDFEDWDDVGLNIPKPAELLNVYRDFLRQTGHSRSPCQNISCQTDPIEEPEMIQPDQEPTETPPESSNPAETPNTTLDPEPEHNAESNVELLEQIERLKEQVVSVEQEKQELRRLWTAERLQDLSVTTPGSELGVALLGNESASMHSATPERFELIEADGKATDEADGNASLADTDNEWTRVRLPNANVGQELLACTDGSSSSTDRSTAALPLPEGPSTRALPAAFQQQVFARCFVSTARHQEKHALDEMLRQEITNDGLVLILGQSLPRIIPNVILNKREEVLALLVATVHLHPSPAERDRLLHLLFNLKKRPQEDERLMILAGVVTIARCSGLGLVENEVLPQCWEQIAHRHVERRLLVAEACSALAPYISSPIRNSLMLSMLQQMLLEDKSDQVREMVVRSLALIITFIDDKDKYFQCEQLAMTALDDPSPEVIASTTNYLLPVLAQWSLDLQRLHTQLFSRLLDKLKANVSDKYINAIEKLLPYLVISVVCCENVARTVSDETPTFEYQLGEGLTNPCVFYDGETPVGLVMGAFDCYVDQEYYEEWEELEWVFSTFLPTLLDAVQQVDAANEPVVSALTSLFRNVCTGFGGVVTRAKVRPQFTVRLQNLEKSLASGRASSDAPMPSLAIIPVYIVGVLASGQQSDNDELTATLKRFLFGLPLCGCPLHALTSAIRGLCAVPGHQEAVTAALWDAVVHPRPVVRLAAAELAVVVVACVAEPALNAKIVPALITLASDADIAVRTASVAAFGALITSTSSKEAQDKTYMQLQSFLADPVSRDSHGMLLQLVATMGAIVTAAEPWFREEVILPQLAAMAAYTMQMSNLTKRLDLANVLVEAFSSAVYCTLSKQCISTALIPGLRYLEPICATSLRTHHDTVLTMIRSAESRIEPQRQPERSNSLASATANVGQGMEDMKKRVSNIFTTKPGVSRPTNLPNLQGIFRKK